MVARGFGPAHLALEVYNMVHPETARISKTRAEYREVAKSLD
jgi:hypothetical protein